MDHPRLRCEPDVVVLSRATVVLAVVLLTIAPTSASAGEGVNCIPGTQVCMVDVETPGTPGAPSSDPAPNTSERVCMDDDGEVVRCYDDRWGWFNDADDCYYQPWEPPPPPTEAVWEEHYPDGAVWDVTCLAPIPGTGGGWTWLPTPPPGYGAAGVTPAQLAQRAVDQMTLTGPAIRMTIEGDEFGIVGVPLWLWTEVGPTTWGPNSATASVPGLAVTATAQARQIVWDMGDGRAETCRNPGTAYYTGGVVSPTCQHVYEKSSAGQPDLAYPVVATTTWDVTWSGGGASGSLSVTRQSTASVRIGEVQVLVTQE